MRPAESIRLARRAVAGFCAAMLFALVAEPSEAASRESILRELARQGYSEVRISRTWLGRTRFVATAPGRQREIILNPSSGAIMRDYTSGRDGNDPIVSDRPPAAQSGRSDQRTEPERQGGGRGAGLPGHPLRAGHGRLLQPANTALWYLEDNTGDAHLGGVTVHSVGETTPVQQVRWQRLNLRDRHAAMLTRLPLRLSPVPRTIPAP